MKVGDIVRFKKKVVRFKKKVLGLEKQRGIIVGDDGFLCVDVYWYKDAKHMISELKEFLEVVSESG